MTNQTERENWRVKRNARNRMIFESNKKLQEEKRLGDYVEKSEAQDIQALELKRAREAFVRAQTKKEEQALEKEVEIETELLQEERQTEMSRELRAKQMKAEIIGKVESEQKISSGSAFLLVGTAIFFDVFQTILNMIPIIGQILSMMVTGVAWGTFKLWFFTKGVKFSQTKTVIIELVPIVNVIPVWTISVLIAIGKDRTGGLFSAVPGMKTVVDKL
jgi:hypothetical protein